MKRLILLLAASLPLFGQSSANIFTIIPTPTLSQVGELRFREKSNSPSANSVGFKSPDTLSTSTIWTLPLHDGTAGQILKTDGAGNLSFVSATFGVPPITITQSAASTTLTVNNTGAGSALSVGTGASANTAVFANTSSGNGVYSSSNTGSGVFGLSANISGVFGQSTGTGTSAIGVRGQATAAGGIGVEAESAGGDALYATSASGLSGHFATGDVLIDHNLTTSGNFTLTSGSFTGAHAQNVGTGDGPAFAQLGISAASGAGLNRPLNWFTSGSFRWDIAMNGTESGSNSGSDFSIDRWSDGGGFLGTPLSISRATGITTLSSLVVTNAASFGSAAVSGSTGGQLLSSTNSGGGAAISGTDSSSSGFGVVGNANGSTSTGVWAHNAGSGDGLFAWNSGGGLSGHFGPGNVLIDNTLTISGNLAVTTGSFTGSHIQNLGSGDSPSFTAITVGSCTGCGGTTYTGGTGVTISGSVISIGQAVGTGNSPTFTGMTLSGGALSIGGNTVFDSSGNLLVGLANDGTGAQWRGAFSGTTGALVTYTNGIYVYNSSGSYVGMIPLI